jgi:putative N6-adenine-specific DNA methylase
LSYRPERPPAAPRTYQRAPRERRVERADDNLAWIFLPCAAGVETLLEAEVGRIVASVVPDAGVSDLRSQRGGVELRGDLLVAMALNLHSRLTQRVLWQVVEGGYRDEHDLYELGWQVRWQDWITPRQTLRVDCTATRSPLRSLHFAALRIKDAVCDQLRERLGERPSVDAHHPDLALVLHVSEDRAMLSVDLSGEALFKRGWREQQGEAPLKETLAAAMLAAADWQGRESDGVLLDPCCGAGTIAIEAAQIACGMAAGLQRRFAFEQLLPFRDLARPWRDLQDQAHAARHAPLVQIVAGDVAFRMTDFAARNAERAGVAQAIELKTMDALQRAAPADHGVLMLNPPYGERIGAKGTGAGAPEHDDQRQDVREDRDPREAHPQQRGSREDFEGGGTPEAFFGALATHWKRGYAGWTAWVLSPDAKLPQAMRLKESRRVPMWNGPIECRLFRFDLVAGSMRKDGGGAAGVPVVGPSDPG